MTGNKFAMSCLFFIKRFHQNFKLARNKLFSSLQFRFEKLFPHVFPTGSLHC